jgi:hypothetical protein
LISNKLLGFFQTREDTFYSRIIQDLQSKLNLVSSENIQLRDHFYKLQNDLEKCLKDRSPNQNGLADSEESAESSSIHLPFNISRETVEKRSKEICQNLIKLFENVDKKLFQFEVDLKNDASMKNVRESEREARLKTQLSQSKQEIELLQNKLECLMSEASKSEVKKRATLTEDFTLKVVRPMLEDSGAPSWSLGRPNVTSSRRTGKTS